jgi:hypothetical protein
MQSRESEITSLKQRIKELKSYSEEISTEKKRLIEEVI